MTNYKFTVPYELFPVLPRFLDVDGFSIHYVDEGAGESLFLLHGNPAWSFLYRKIIAALRSDFRCIALDFPGYGMLDAPAGYGFTPKEHSIVLERFVDRLGLKDLTLMVQDTGGAPSALALQAAAPSSCAGSLSATLTPGRSTACGASKSSAG
jgi:pimeloyl-ACP methyl ester carboxylesterase